jgi:hypothetical protein
MNFRVAASWLRCLSRLQSSRLGRTADRISSVWNLGALAGCCLVIVAIEGTCPTVASAQDSRVDVTVLAGPARTNLRGLQEALKNKWNPIAGLVLEHSTNRDPLKRLGIGAFLNTRFARSDAGGGFKLTYLDIPMTVAYYGMSDSPTHMRNGLEFFGGPTIGLRVSARQIDGPVSLDVSNDTRAFDIGLTIGAGLLVHEHLAFQVRYQRGFIDAAKSEAVVLRSGYTAFLIGLKWP